MKSNAGQWDKITQYSIIINNYGVKNVNVK